MCLLEKKFCSGDLFQWLSAVVSNVHSRSSSSSGSNITAALVFCYCCWYYCYFSFIIIIFIHILRECFFLGSFLIRCCTCFAGGAFFALGFMFCMIQKRAFWKRGWKAHGSSKCWAWTLGYAVYMLLSRLV